MWAGPDLFQLAKHLPNMKEIREQGEIIAIVFGWLLAVVKGLSEYAHSRAGATSRRNKELQRAGELVAFLSQLPAANLPEQQSKSLHKEGEKSLQEILHEIEKLNARTALLDRDPNSRLHFAQKCFLLFRPKSRTGMALVGLTYAALLALLSVLVTRHASLSKGYIFEVSAALLAVVLFHRWTLEERRRALGAPVPSNSRLFFIHLPATIRVFLAQVTFLLTNLFLIVIIYREIAKGFKSLAGFFIFFPFFALSAFIYYHWGRSEIKFLHVKPELSPFHVAMGQLGRSLTGFLTLLFAIVISALSLLITLVAVVDIAINPATKGAFEVLIISVIMAVLPAYAALRTIKIESAFQQAKHPPEENAAEALATSA